MSQKYVVKIGGSLINVATRVIHELIKTKKPILIVPGGSIFANTVRSVNVTDNTAAHWMAIASMDQYGWYLSTLNNNEHIDTETRCVIPNTGIKVLLPYKIMRENDPLPHTWDVSSDTIAAWIAFKLKCPLILIKSVDGIITNPLNPPITDITGKNPIQTDIIDSYCWQFVNKHNIQTTIVNGQKKDAILNWFTHNTDTIIP
ncbi:MAG TPA: uridylate kinase [Methanocorpusculum sp.]|nr:uridylate kinase [Methanocorpusculum sp.]